MADRSSAGERTLPLPDEAATTRLAEDLAAILRRSDVIRLEGDLGAGKSSFARALLRAFANDAMLEVPSPTFTLVQSYEFPRLGISHFDLYRLGGADELDEIGFDEAIRAGAALIEWPERAEDAIPHDALTLRLDPGPHVGARIARLSGPADWMARIDRTLAIHAFLADNGWGDAARRHVKADASARSIERASRAGDTRILMNHPPETDDVAGLARRAARAAAKLAEDSHAFVAIATGLRDRGFSAPRIDAHDGARGLILMEDFGDAFIAAEGQPITDRYIAAVEVLADLHGQSLPRAVPAGAGSIHSLPEYDLGDLLVQIEPFLDWAMPHLLQRAATPGERTSFLGAWRPHLAEIVDSPKTWALRDYHSPNLMWLPDRTGSARVGLLDFQDAVLLHPAYDLASVAQDARVTISPELETALVAHYVNLRTLAQANFDTAAFARAYAVLAAQRATRILGIFARLANRDGRPEYLVHYPRMMSYLNRGLQAPGLGEIRAWMERHVGVA